MYGIGFFYPFMVIISLVLALIFDFPDWAISFLIYTLFGG